MREQFYSLTRMVREIDTKGPLHIDRKYESKEHGMTFEFWWDPYINSTRTVEMLNTTDPDNRPSLLVIGSGIWYMRHLGDRYFDEWRKGVDRVMDAVQSSSKVADAVLLSPVEIPQFDRLNAVRQQRFTMDKINRMNNYLKGKEPTLDIQTPFAVPFAWNSICSSTVNQTDDGLHYKPTVTTVQATLGLNYRCNDLLPKHFPMANTCCMQYPTPAWYQNLILLYFLLWIPIGFYVLSPGKLLMMGLGFDDEGWWYIDYPPQSHIDSHIQFMRRFYPSETTTLTSLFIFGLGVVYMYIGDRSHLFGKHLKKFDASTFGWLMLVMVIGGIVSLRRKKEGDQGFLNRAQTDEWKGWMQIIILVYHFTGASQTPGIYNAMRVLVAAYLFQTGYGHFFFFYKKADFGMARVLNVMVRLNLLTLVLEYVMDTNYLSYYFTPLVSFWFGVIWVTMYIGHKHNTKAWFLFAKILVMGALTGVFIHVPGILEATFQALEVLFNIHWDAVEWRFRLALDAWIVYVGMVFAYATLKFNENKLHEHALWSLAIKPVLAIISCLALWWFFWFELSQPNKQAYTLYHPYISWIPILAFITLRNATVFLRNTTSGFFEFIGKCSLETFIGQFHMWLAADTKGLLIVLTDPSWAVGLGWFFNLALSSCIFMLVCYHLNQATGTITKWICSSANNASFSNTSSTTSSSNQQQQQDAVPLLPTTVQDNDDTKPEDDETWQQPLPSKPSLWRRVAGDLRVRSLLFLIFLGMINHLC